MGGRLTRGRSYARAGQVLSLRYAPGRGHRARAGLAAEPYRVTIALPAFDARRGPGSRRRWPAQAIYLARLLAGEMPGEIEEVFTGPAHRCSRTGRRTRDGVLVPGLGRAVQAHRGDVLPARRGVRRRPVRDPAVARAGPGDAAGEPAGTARRAGRQGAVRGRRTVAHRRRRPYCPMWPVPTSARRSAGSGWRRCRCRPGRPPCSPTPN